jgi:tetratricopeptide (TPR) repeat protein
MHDELRIGGAWYLMAECYEKAGQLEEAANLLERVVRVDRKYQLPKLAENAQRLQALRTRLGGKADQPMNGNSVHE